MGKRDIIMQKTNVTLVILGCGKSQKQEKRLYVRDVVEVDLMERRAIV